MKFLRFVFSRSGKARRLLFGAVVVGMLAGSGSVGLLALVNRSLRQSAHSTLAHVGLLFAGLCVLVTVGRVSSVGLLSLLGQGMVKELRLELSRQILAAPLPTLEKLGPHRLLATLTDDINALTQALVFVPVVFINGTIVIGSLGYMAWLDSKLFLMLLGVVVLGVATYRLPVALGMRRFQEAREEQDALFGHFEALTDGVKELKLHRRRRWAFSGNLTETVERVRRLRVVAAMIYGTAASWGHLLFFVVIGLLLLARPDFIGASHDTLVGYTVVLLYMMTPLQNLLDNLPIVGRAEVAVDKVRTLGFSLASVQEAGVDEPPAEEEAAAWSRLELRGVTHTYRREGQDRDFRLGPVDLALAPGELVFLVGGNGSGKTTLAKILVGLYAPEEGAVAVDDRPVAGGEGMDEYRQLFSVVFSDFFLFEELLGLETAEVDDQARRHLESLQLAHKVQVQDGRLSTTELSQGQRKRLALLTAYLEDRPIYLFDEWAADQDPMFKEIFYREILAELQKRGKTIVVISHDDRYYPLADRVIKLEDGQLEYDGPWEETQVLAGRAQAH
jgi:putative ATP-binding cassette transporter